jgi:hypothetical protein
MSDRTLVIDQSTGTAEHHVELFMDGESGTWRLFISDAVYGRQIILGQECTQRNILGNVDFSLEGIRLFHASLTKVLKDIESDPVSFNAEVRAKWNE